VKRKRPPLWQRLLRDPVACTGAAVVILAIALAVASTVANLDPNAVNLVDRLQPPGEGGYLLGTDSLGRDVAARIIHGSRVSLLVGFGATLISLVVGVPLGLLAGYFGGHVDDLIMRVGDVQLGFPAVLLALAILVALGPGLLNVIVVLGIAAWVQYARLVRGQVLSMREEQFVDAARALGASHLRVMLRHLLPNAAAPIIIVATFTLALNIIIESTLSFLGVGLPLSVPTWGSMLAGAREFLQDAWWLATFPGLAIALTVMGVNILGDWLRDELDPRLRAR
jgi:peptide/nickel transport system permease protein